MSGDPDNIAIVPPGRCSFDEKAWPIKSLSESKNDSLHLDGCPGPLLTAQLRLTDISTGYLHSQWKPDIGVVISSYA